VEIERIIGDRTEALLCLAWWPLMVLGVVVLFFVTPLLALVLFALAWIDRFLLTKRIQQRVPVSMFRFWTVGGLRAQSQACQVLVSGS